MKKTYIEPKSKLIKLVEENILCLSGGSNGDGRPAQSAEMNWYFDDENEDFWE